MRVLYNILFTFFFVLASPYYFWRMQRRGNWTEGFAQRFGKYDAKFKQSITNRHTLWLHAVSVGEVGLCTQLIRALEPRLPNVKIIVSTTTTTGMGELHKYLPPHIGKIYYPIDRKLYVMRALSVIHPEAIVLVEAEIWPNFIWRAQGQNMPLFLANARFSDRSFPRYKRFGFLFRRLFAAFTGVSVQNEIDAVRARELGCRPEVVEVVGNLKFDAAKIPGKLPLNVDLLLRQMAVPEHAKIIVAGSTHAGEEALLAQQFLRLRKQFPDLFLIVVPRHFERSKQVGKELEQAGVKFAYRSELTASTTFEPGEVECLLVNSTGELRHFYGCATVVFVGKSLTAQGGQNPIEPAELGKAVVFGPHMQNFPDISRQFVEQKGAVQVHDAAELEKVFAELLDDETRRLEMGRNALRVIRSNEGGIGRTVEMIVKHFEDGDMYIKPAE